MNNPNDSSMQLNKIINELTIRLNRNTPVDNWKYLSIIPVSPSPLAIQIKFADIYQKDYFLNHQTLEEIACDFERNLYEKLYKLYKKGVISHDDNDWTTISHR